MALKFFRQRDIEKMDAGNIPEEFINYFETLDDSSKEALIGSRPDLAKALDFGLPKTDTEESGLESAPESQQDYIDEEEAMDDLELIQQNFYEGKDLDEILVTNMPELEALAIPDEATTCMLHRTPLEKKQINFKGPGTRGTFGIMTRVCRECHRVFLEESKMFSIHKALMDRGILHTFYDLDLTTQYLHSQMPPYEFTKDDILWIPDTWVEEDPRCPIHEEALYEVHCLKRYKDREIRFTSYVCDRCEKMMMRRATVYDLQSRCAESGIPKIDTERLVKKKPFKKPIPPQDVKSDYIIENGQRTKFNYLPGKNCYPLSENDTVIVSDSIYCAIDSHNNTEEIVAFIWVLEKHGDRKGYLFHLGYCSDCQKYYMAQEDYQVLYSIGRPEVTLLRDIDDTEYYITSGAVFNLERNHLGKVEKQITDEVQKILNSPDYVSPYKTGYYDDGILGHAKHVSKTKYSKQLEQLEGYTSKPYSYRVDISLEDVTETYYIGAKDIILNGKWQVISANSDFGHELINYQTIKINKDGKEYGIKLSRQFEIENASLYGYMNLRTDEDIIFKSGITDPFLVKALNMRKRQHSLTDIFVTIQENQNRIVNAPFTQNIIVQGCAGSGKTMVLLHRLSSLNYKERNFDFSKNAFILTPNDQFSLHIKGIAEELQIGTIGRASVEQYYIEILQRYSPEFKPDVKVTSEMIVRQSYVDYIYSDQFRADFNAAYDVVLEKRNALVITLNDLLDAMGQSNREIDLSDDSNVIRQIKNVVDSMYSLVKRRESEIIAAEDDYQKHIARKQYLKERTQTLRKTSTGIVRESIPRVYAKIGTYLSERQYIVSGLEEQIGTLKTEKKNLNNRRFIFGKRARLDDLDSQIKAAERKRNAENQRQEEELPILSMPTEGLSEEEALSWMRQVMLIVPDVADEVRLCNNIREENQKLTEELAGIDVLIEIAKNIIEEKRESQYSDEIKRVISYLLSETDKYTMLKTFQLVYDRATESYRELHKIKNIRGKYHRYDLYAELLFAMRFYDSALGTTQFMCVDEGQDLALNEYRLLYELNGYRLVFNIFGDINQLMKPGRGITDWSQLQKTYGAQIYELNENYRNTNQITKFCNSSFGMNVTLTGVDGVNVREIPRKELETELAALKITSERIAILFPRGVQKNRYLNLDLLPSSVIRIIGDTIGNGFISLMYVDEVKGIEFHKAYVVGNRMSRNEKYIAYTRALSELILVIDELIEKHNDADLQTQELSDAKTEKRTQTKKKKEGRGVLGYKGDKKKSGEDKEILYKSTEKKEESKDVKDITEQLVEIFVDTQNYYKENAILAEAVGYGRQQTALFEPDDYPMLPDKDTNQSDTIIRVTKSKTFEAAMKLHKEFPDKKIAVLNFASATNPGGGVWNGSRAQEESLCRCSTLYPTIDRNWLLEKYYKVNRARKDVRYSDACIYSPGVVICKTDDLLPVRLDPEDFVTVDVITCAAPNLRYAPADYHNPETGKAVRMDPAELFKLHERRARHILHLAAYHQVDVLILGAFGCGAFANDPFTVAKAFREAINVYRGWFNLIEFAIYCRDHESENYDAFNHIMSSDPSPNSVHTSELSRYVTPEIFEKVYVEFLKQADENAISKKGRGPRYPDGIRNGDGRPSFDGANVSQHFGQGGASRTPYINWWVVSIYYITDSGEIVLGIEEDRYSHIEKMKPLKYAHIGNKRVKVAVFYETTRSTINYKELYEKFITVCEEVMKHGLT